MFSEIPRYTELPLWRPDQIWLTHYVEQNRSYQMVCKTYAGRYYVTSESVGPACCCKRWGGNAR